MKKEIEKQIENQIEKLEQSLVFVNEALTSFNLMKEDLKQSGIINLHIALKESEIRSIERNIVTLYILKKSLNE